MLEASYARAREDLAFRADFAATVPLHAQPWIRRVRYRETQASSYNPILDEQVPELMVAHRPVRTALYLKGGRATIDVFPAAFDEYTTSGDFLAALLLHEGKHAKDFAECPEQVFRPVGEPYSVHLWLLGELRADRHLSDSPQTGLTTPQFRASLAWRLNELHSELYMRGWTGELAGHPTRIFK